MYYSRYPKCETVLKETDMRVLGTKNGYYSGWLSLRFCNRFVFTPPKPAPYVKPTDRYYCILQITTKIDSELIESAAEVLPLDVRQ